MIASLALIFLSGMAAASLCQRLRMPRLVGVLVVGIAAGPFALNLLGASILSISADLRKIALVIILIKAGLSLDPAELKKVGRPALLMSFLPASLEIAAFALFAPSIFGISPVEAALMGAVTAAVSPAVVVPKMVQLMENRLGTEKGVPQLILAGASLDDVFVIVLFSTFCNIAQGSSASAADFAGIPLSILFGVLAGVAAGTLLALLFEAAHARRRTVRNSAKTILVLGIAFLLVALEDMLKARIPFSGLLAVISMACVLRCKCPPTVSQRLSQKFGKLWIAAEVLLFFLVGAAVDLRYTLSAGAKALLMLIIALTLRASGVLLALTGTNLNRKERLFCVISCLPKATVQAAIGSVPLSLGLPCGRLILSIVVLSILITAPLGALGMELSCNRLLQKQQR